uniref:Amino acid transporter transmembrane domain-containing protein n=1 Tax=Eucampia antarctica TaxID=49252 RepID=A0A7S2RK46_9STRA
MTDETSERLTKLILCAITAVALMLKNAGFVVSLVGALLGSAIIYIFPSILFLKFTSTRLANRTILKSKRLTLERLANKILFVFGVFCAILGVAVTVLTEFFPGTI